MDPAAGGGCSRRVFLGTSCAWLTATLARARSASPRFGRRSPLPHHATSPSARRAPSPSAPPAARAGLVRARGYDGIELGPEYLDRSADQIGEALAGTG